MVRLGKGQNSIDTETRQMKKRMRRPKLQINTTPSNLNTTNRVL